MKRFLFILLRYISAHIKTFAAIALLPILLAPIA
jgi:hypothetical protein